MEEDGELVDAALADGRLHPTALAASAERIAAARVLRKRMGGGMRQVGLLAAERTPAMLFELARSRLERVTIDAPVLALGLVARHLPPFVPATRDLFDTRPQQARPWPQLRERLRARLGDDAVYRVAPADDPRPERAWTRVFGDTGAPAPTAPPRPERPAWLLPAPVLCCW